MESATNSTVIETIIGELNRIADILQSNDVESVYAIEAKLMALQECLLLITNTHGDDTNLHSKCLAALDLVNISVDTLACVVHQQTQEKGYATSLLHTGSRGRPAFDITVEQLEHLMEQNFTATDIAGMMGLSESTIRRRCKAFNINFRGKFSAISDDDLDALVSEQMKAFPDMGYRMMQGVLCETSTIVTSNRVLASMKRIDYFGVLKRSLALNVTPRRKYNVLCPQAMWHLDGHHKLIRFRLVTHGGIDGYSRMVVFLRCSDNNRAETVLDAFTNATEVYGVPSRIRTDKGGENIDVARFMLDHPQRGPERGSVITGPSTHNTRIERLWRDVFKGCIQLFYFTFYDMEDRGMLDSTNNTHIWCLHYVYLPRINQRLELFRLAYNKHKLRTAGNRSPEQLWTSGLLNVANTTTTVVQDHTDQTMDIDMYGVDSEAPLPAEADVTVNVPPTATPIMSEEDFQMLNSTIDVLRDSDCNGQDIYEEVLHIVRQKTLNA